MIVFRTDGNPFIGLGHVMRCLSLADALKRKGQDCLFVLSAKDVEDLIQDRGYNTFILDGSSYDSLENELSVFIPFLLRVSPSALIVDSYFVTKKYLSELKQIVKIVYFDDLYSFSYPVDCLINYNIYGEKMEYESIYAKEGEELPLLLTGASYAPLREAFQNTKPKTCTHHPWEVLISTGGADPLHISVQLLSEMLKTDFDDEFHFKLLVGNLNRDKEKILSLAKELPQVEIISQVKEMKQLLDSCDLALSAAGSTLYELCALGIPTVTYVFADNQLKGAECFSKKGIMLYCGDARLHGNISKSLLKAIWELAKDETKREKMAMEMRRVVDGRGADRLAKAIIVSFV